MTKFAIQVVPLKSILNYSTIYSRYGVNTLGPLCLWQCLLDKDTNWVKRMEMNWEKDKWHPWRTFVRRRVDFGKYEEQESEKGNQKISSSTTTTSPSSYLSLQSLRGVFKTRNNQLLQCYNFTTFICCNKYCYNIY